MNKSAKIIIAFAAGAAAGVLAGILLAPDKGSETRKKIAEVGKRVGDSISDAIEACAKNKKEFAESGREG